MSELKLKYDKARENNISKNEKEEAPKQDDNIVLYDTESNVRNLCLILQDGKRIFLNYAFLISGEFLPEDSKITLVYTTHTVTLKGHTLEALFEALIAQTPKRISSLEQRYIKIREQKENVVTEISVVEIKK